jgi:fermentation-respiration switch protein FrsA (DUF1100 family)
MRREILAVAFAVLLLAPGTALAQEPADATFLEPPAAQEPAPQPGSDAQPEPVDAAAIPARRPPPTIADFTDEPLVGEAALAPGGRYVAYVHRMAEVSYLVVSDLEDPESKPFVRRLGEVRVYGLKWINDDRLVYSAGANEVSVDVRRGKVVFTGVPRLFASNRDLNDTLVFFEGDKRIEQANIIATSDINLVTGDSEHFVIPLRVGRKLDLVRINARDGKWTTIAGGDDRTIAWFVERSGRPAMRFDANRRFTEVRVMIPQFRDNGNIDWKHAFSTRIGREEGRTREFSPIGPGPQPGFYYVIGRPEGSDRAGVHLYNLVTQRYASEVFAHDKVDVEGALVDSATGIFIGAYYWNDTREMTFVEGRLQNHFDALWEFFEKERSISVIDRSADQQTWLIRTSGPRDPGTLHVYSMTKMHNEFIATANPQLAPDRLGKVEAIAYKARDGLDVRGYLTLPPDPVDGEKPPLIVMPHGGPEVRDAMTYDVVVQYLATRGYAVFQPNFRGSSGYGKAFVDAGNRQFGGAMQTDIVDGVQMLIEQGRVDGSRMCIFGESYGGYAALMGAVQFPDLYRCAVSASGLSDLNRQLRWERDEEGRDSEAYKYWVAKIGDPDRDKAAMEAASPIRNLDAIRIPILLMHGTADDTVPFEQSDLFHQALKKTGKPVKIIVFEDTGHNLRGDTLETFLTQLEQFFGEHLAPPTSH